MENLAKPPRLSIFDWLRSLAILLVITDHIFNQMSVFYPHASFMSLIRLKSFSPLFSITLGGAGVIIFLVLSGMVLEYNYGYGRRSIKYFSFIFKRFKKIYSLYWVCLILSFF